MPKVCAPPARGKGVTCFSTFAAFSQVVLSQLLNDSTWGSEHVWHINCERNRQCKLAWQQLLRAVDFVTPVKATDA